MSRAPARRATYDDIVKLPENVVGEIIGGELVVSPRPVPRHALASSMLTIDIGGSFGHPPRDPESPGGWLILDEPELWFGDDVLVPDLAGWRRERMPKLPETAGFQVAPDWLCEVLSPSTARWDRGGKMDIYARVGVASYWIVDPELRTIEIYRLDTQRWTRVSVFSGDGRLRAEPFDAVELLPSRWWAE
jgi:Uma2 family endonuclease